MKLQILRPALHRERLHEKNIAPVYTKLRLQVFLGIFIGYAGYYLVRKERGTRMSIWNVARNVGWIDGRP